MGKKKIGIIMGGNSIESDFSTCVAALVGNSLERLGEVRIAVIFVVCVCHKEGCRCGQQREELQTGGSRTQELECPAVLS